MGYEDVDGHEIVDTRLNDSVTGSCPLDLGATIELLPDWDIDIGGNRYGPFTVLHEPMPSMSVINVPRSSDTVEKYSAER